MSISRAQAAAIADGFLDSIGTSRQGNDLPVIEEMLKQAALDLMEEAVKNLESAAAVDRAKLSSELTFSLSQSGSTYTLSVGYPAGSDAAKYYDFVNKGVDGTRTSHGSKYKYRNNAVSKAFALSILKWMQRRGISARNIKKPVSTVERRNLSIRSVASQASGLKSLAYATARSIKMYGRRPTHYFDNAVKDVFDAALSEALAVALGAEVRLRIREMNNEMK